MINLISEALVWDAHAGIFPSPNVDLDTLGTWQTHHVNYLSINVGFDVMRRDETLATLAAYRRWILARPENYVLAGTLEDIKAAHETGKLAISFDIEGMNALGGDLNMVSIYHALGVRQMLFAYNLGNDAAGGCHDADTGLTPFGCDILSEMNRVGMIVDASHTSYQTSMELIERSATPVVFSHSNPASVWRHQRNICDDQIKACAAKGGVVGLNGLGIFLGENDVSKAALLRHLQHLLDVAGSQHVGLGFDYTPDLKIDLSVILSARPDYWPTGQQYDTSMIGHAGPDCIPVLVEAMQSWGLTGEEIRGVVGGNFARVAKQSWKGELHTKQTNV